MEPTEEQLMEFLRAMKAFQEELKTQGTKMEMMKTNQEEAETNRKADHEALQEIRSGQAELKSVIEEKMEAVIQSRWSERDETIQQ
jgi:deoxyribodipyrimidine photolyase-like uncharacterized protein